MRGGYPPSLQEDWVSCTASSFAGAVQACPSWLADISQSVLATLQVARLTRRMMIAFGNSSSSASGQAQSTIIPALIGCFGPDMIDLEQRFGATTDIILTTYLGKARMQLQAFTLQAPPNIITSEERTSCLLECYANAMSMINLSLLAENASEWPAYARSGLYMASVRREKKSIPQRAETPPSIRYVCYG